MSTHMGYCDADRSKVTMDRDEVLSMFWIIAIVVVVVLVALAWWTSGPRFNAGGRLRQPPDYEPNSPVYKYGGGNNGGGLG